MSSSSSPPSLETTPVIAQGLINKPPFSKEEAATPEQQAWALLWQMQKTGSTSANLKYTPGKFELGNGISPGQLGLTPRTLVDTWNTLNGVSATELGNYLSTYARDPSKGVQWKTLDSYGAYGGRAGKTTFGPGTYFWGLPLKLGTQYPDFVSYVRTHQGAAPATTTDFRGESGDKLLHALGKNAPSTEGGRQQLIQNFDASQRNRNLAERDVEQATKNLEACLNTVIPDVHTRAQAMACAQAYADKMTAFRKAELQHLVDGLGVRSNADKFLHIRDSLTGWLVADLRVPQDDAERDVKAVMARYGDDFIGALYALMAQHQHLPVMMKTM